MKPLYNILEIFIFLLLKDITKVQAAALICSDNKPTVDLADHKANVENNNTVEYKIDNDREGNINSLNKIFHSLQCTLEKAKPWVAELQQEAKRLEEAAKILGLGILNSFGDFVDKLVDGTSAETATEVNATASEENSSSMENVTEEISQYLCPEGFIADHNGICERED